MELFWPLCHRSSSTPPVDNTNPLINYLNDEIDEICQDICMDEICEEICKEGGDVFPPCDCQHRPPIFLQKSIKDVKNGTDPQDPNCTAICKETSEGFPFCDCNNNVPLKIQNNLIEKPEIKSMDDNNADLYDCDVICKGTSDGFPMCDCGLSPPVRLIPKIPKNPKRIFPKKRILPIQLFKNQKSPPFAHHYP